MAWQFCFWLALCRVRRDGKAEPEETVVLLEEESENEAVLEEDTEQKSAGEEESRRPPEMTETEMIVVYVCGDRSTRRVL